MEVDTGAFKAVTQSVDTLTERVKYLETRERIATEDVRRLRAEDRSLRDLFGKLIDKLTGSAEEMAAGAAQPSPRHKRERHLRLVKILIPASAAAGWLAHKVLAHPVPAAAAGTVLAVLAGGAVTAKLMPYDRPPPRHVQAHARHHRPPGTQAPPAAHVTPPGAVPGRGLAAAPAQPQPSAAPSPSGFPAPVPIPAPTVTAPIDPPGSPSPSPSGSAGDGTRGVPPKVCELRPWLPPCQPLLVTLP